MVCWSTAMISEPSSAASSAAGSTRRGSGRTKASRIKARAATGPLERQASRVGQA